MQSLLLGTAHWGMAYGITNKAGRLSDAAVAETLDVARDAGITTVDTAPGYGDAESRIRIHAPGFVVQTKLNAADSAPEALGTRVAISLERLGRTSVWSLIVHDWPSVAISERRAVAEQVESLRDSGLAERVGISGYTPADLRSALDSFRHLDVAQMPVSVLDQRLEGAAEVAELHARGGALQARSILLQGVASGAPCRFSDHPDVRRLTQTPDTLGLAVGYVSSRQWIDEVVLGVTSAEELAQLLEAHAAPAPLLDWAMLASHDPDLIDPRRWGATP